MLKKITIGMFLIIISSCKSYDLIGKKYLDINQEKTVSIEFINDTLCNVKQEFLCEKIPENYRKIDIIATYKISRMSIKTYNASFKSKRFKANILIIKNLDCVNCKKYDEIPDYLKLNCSNIIEDEKLKRKIKHGVIYNLINDTLVINKNQIFFDNLSLKIH